MINKTSIFWLFAVVANLSVWGLKGKAEGHCVEVSSVFRTYLYDASSVSGSQLSIPPTSVTISPPSSCAGNQDVLMLQANGGSGEVCRWYISGCGNIFIGEGSVLATSMPAVTTTYYARWESPGDTSSCASATFVVVPLPSAPDSVQASPSVTCAGNPVMLAAWGGSVGTGDVVEWFSDGCGITPVGLGSSVVVNPIATQTYYARTVNACGSSMCKSVVVTISTAPSAPVAINISSDTICKGNQVSLSVIGPPLAEGEQWCWYADGCGLSPVGFGDTIVVTPQQSTLYQVRAESVCGISSCISQSVFVWPLEANAGEDLLIGYGSQASLYGSGLAGSGNYSWQWSPSSQLVNPTIQNPLTVQLMSFTTFTLTVTDLNTQCTANDDVDISINGLPVEVNAGASPTAVCAGEEVFLSAIPMNGSGNYSYSWSSEPPGFYSSEQNPTAIPMASALYSVVVSDGIGLASDTVSITVFPLPQSPALPQGPDTVDYRLSPSSSYWVPTVDNAGAYEWVLDPDSLGIVFQSDTTATIFWQYVGQGVLRCNALNSCGQTTGEALSLIVDYSTSTELLQSSSDVFYPNPVQTTLIVQLSNPSEVCVYSFTGQIVYTSAQALRHIVNMSGLPAGVYLVHTAQRSVLVQKVD